MSIRLDGSAAPAPAPSASANSAIPSVVNKAIQGVEKFAQSAFAPAPAAKQTTAIAPMSLPSPGGIGGPTDASRKAELNATTLPAPQKQSLTSALSGALGTDAQTNARRSLDAVAYVPVQSQTQALSNVALNPGGSDATHIANALNSPSWDEMTSGQQQSLCRVLGVANSSVTVSPGNPSGNTSFDQAGSNVFANLDSLCQNPTRMLNTDKDGNSLVTNLDKIATQPLNSAVAKAGVTNASLLASTVDETNAPGDIEQRDYSTCTVTSMEYGLSKTEPSEYARIIGGLSGSSGQAATAGGKPLTLQTEYYTAPLTSNDIRNGDDRTPTSAMFQNAAMDYADGGHYDAATDVTNDSGFLGIGGEPKQGLNDGELSSVASAVYGKSYNGRDDGGFQLPWSSNDKGLSYLQGYKDTSSPVLVSFKMKDGGGHELAFDHCANGRVYLRNPWGDESNLGTDPNGNPAFRQEPGSSGMVSISDADYQKYANGIVSDS